jgi:uncharacterized protein (TIGR02466 family)
MMELINKNFNIWTASVEIPVSAITNIYELQQKDPVGYKKSNYGGWHSKSFVYTQKYNRRDYSWIVDTIANVDCLMNTLNYQFSRAWFNINSKGNSNNWHHHGQHPFVGVLYINVPDNSGDIEFKKSGELFSYTPSAGEFLAFPGTMEHRVLENMSTENRISLAINFE